MEQNTNETCFTRFSKIAPNRPVDGDFHALQEAFSRWDKTRCTCALLSLLLDATRSKENSTWPVERIVITKKNLTPYLFYLWSSNPKLLLVIDCSSRQEPMIWILGASAYQEPLSIGSVPFAIKSVAAPNFVEQLVAEHKHGEWCLHCGLYVAKQG